jgi:hypothetical protein
MIMLATNQIVDVVAEWRDQANTFRDHAQESVAIAYERCAKRLEVLLSEHAGTLLTLKEASAIGGYSVDHLGRMLREGGLPNAGRTGAPRIRRVDVPTKPGYVAPGSATPQLGIEQIVRSVIDEGVG